MNHVIKVIGKDYENFIFGQRPYFVTRDRITQTGLYQIENDGGERVLVNAYDILAITIAWGDIYIVSAEVVKE